MHSANHPQRNWIWLRHLWLLTSLLVACLVPRPALGSEALLLLPSLCEAAPFLDVNHLPHARAIREANEHAFAGEVAPPQANSSEWDVLSRSHAAPRMARVGAGKHLGMPKDLVAGDGAVAWSATHSAYGRVVATYADETARSRYGTAINSPFRLLGQVADDDAELCFTRYRCFDPEIGSWISSDPLEVAGGLNLYGFDGAPTDVVDPLGLAGNKHENIAGQGGVTVNPKDIKGARPWPDAKPGHPDAHGVSREDMADIMNDPKTSVYRGTNTSKTPRPVDFYHRDGTTVVTEQGEPTRVITAFGKLATKGDNGKKNERGQGKASSPTPKGTFEKVR
ncbi:MAG: RHS repeat-associated core domain-containing protein [Polyangiaceae bacterium]